MTFRSAEYVRESIVEEITRIFDAGAEVRFFAGAQPAPDDVASPVWVASRPILATSETSSVAGWPVTFTATPSPLAASLAVAVAQVSAGLIRKEAAADAFVVSQTEQEAQAALVVDAETAVVLAQAAHTECLGRVTALNVLKTAEETAAASARAEYDQTVGDIPALNRAYQLALTYWLTAVQNTTSDVVVSTALAASGLANDAASAAALNAALAAQAVTAAETVLAAAEIARTSAFNQGLPTAQLLAADAAVADAVSVLASTRTALVTADHNATVTAAAAVAAQADYDAARGDYGYETQWTRTAEAAKDTAKAALDAERLVILMPEVLAMLAAAEAAEAAVEAAVALVTTTVLEAATLGQAVVTLEAEKAIVVASGAWAQTEYAGAYAEKAAAESNYNQAVAARSSILADTGALYAEIPSSGWCRIVHPAYPNVYIDGTFGAEGGDTDFTVNVDESHYSLSTLYPLTLTLPVV